MLLSPCLPHHDRLHPQTESQGKPFLKGILTDILSQQWEQLLTQFPWLMFVAMDSESEFTWVVQLLSQREGSAGKGSSYQAR